MEFSDIKAGDTIRVTTPAHMAPKGFSAQLIQKPETSVTVRVDVITSVNGQPGRKQAYATVLVTAAGEDLAAMDYSDRPTFHFFSDSPIAAQSFEKV